MNLIEEKIADIIRENDAETAAKVIYNVMAACVAAPAVATTANVYRTVDRLVDSACESLFQ